MTALTPVFVVGAWHSGTYLMVHALARHSTIQTIEGETHYFFRREKIREATLAAPEPERWHLFVRSILNHGPEPTISHADQQAFAERLTNERPFDPADLGGMFAFMMERLCAEQGRTMWVEKSPSHVACLFDIKETFPDAKVIHMVRDPKAVMASTRIRSKKPGGNEIKDIYHPVHESITWREAVRKGRAFGERYPDSFLEINYESLIVDGEPELKKVCDFIGRTYEPDMLQVKQVNAASADEQGKTGFDRAPLERWRKVLGPTEFFILKRFCSREMAFFDYEIPRPGFPIFGLTAEAFRGAAFVWKKIAATSKNPDGLGLGDSWRRLRSKYGS